MLSLTSQNVLWVHWSAKTMRNLAIFQENWDDMLGDKARNTTL